MLLVVPNLALTLLLSNNAAGYVAIIGIGVAMTGYSYWRERAA